MKINSIIWLDDIVDKLALKHKVEPHEVEELLGSKPQFRFLEKGDRKSENIYIAFGQTDEGRYLTVLFILKKDNEALVLSARDMARKERKLYEKK